MAEKKKSTSKKRAPVEDDEESSSEDSLLPKRKVDDFVFGGHQPVVSDDSMFRSLVLTEKKSKSRLTKKGDKVSKKRRTDDKADARVPSKARDRVPEGAPVPLPSEPKILGKGAYGSVYSVADMAVKVFDNPSSFVQEAVALRYLENQPNIVRWEGFDTSKMKIWMKNYEDNMRNFVSKNSLSRTTRTKLLIDVANSVHCLHSLGLMHSDIKSGNILIRRESAHLADLGFVSSIGHGRIHRTTENARDPQPGNDIGHDIFSIGCMISKMFSRTKMTKAAEVTTYEDFQRHAQGIEDGHFKALALRCISRDRSTRPTAAEIVRELGGNVQTVAPISLPASSTSSPHRDEMVRWKCYHQDRGCRALNYIIQKYIPDNEIPYRDCIIFILLSCFSSSSSISKYPADKNLDPQILNNILVDTIAVKYILDSRV